MTEALQISPKVRLWLNIATILLLLIATVVMFRLTLIIRSDGGKCTASPLGYTEYLLKEQTGIDYACSCSEATKFDMQLRNLSFG